MLKIILVSIFFYFSISVWAEEGQKNSEKEGYTLKPVLLDGSNSNSIALGIEYGLSNGWVFKGEEDEYADSDSDVDENGYWVDDVNKKVRRNSGYLKYELSGVWTSEEETNPESFSKVKIELGYDYFRPSDSWNKDFDFYLAYSMEGDQDFDNRQEVTSASFSGYFGNPKGTYIVSIIELGQVDASENEQRMALTTIDKFDRLSGEVAFKYKLDFGESRKYKPKSIGINYRYFSEKSAPQSIKSAGLDKFKRYSIVLKFEHGLYIAYSKGELPFDLQEEKVLKVGLTHNLF
ncbi:hypothetical protein [Aliikangiella coralliicola]|uniref:DUF481 domain-containing protein n=1 Tax=Aliikangiella coralliicola TaxID=2592383 RepID=A0A545UDN1_9GAMM|nr:hypothetical protein [Aliikangiella coralliicola]TQV87577.1 hypothetical protein FLL46_11945 [Aliikangiella coralliicola]